MMRPSDKKYARYSRKEPHTMSSGHGSDSSDRGDGFIASGSYGMVYRGIDNETGMEVALKTMNKDTDPKEGYIPSTLREILILRHMRHENIVQYLDIVQHSYEDDENGQKQSGFGNDFNKFPDTKITLVMDLADINLKEFMDNSVGHVDDATVQSFSRQILQGVKYCHEVGVMHRDLKPQNILIKYASDGRSIIKIADFGLSRPLNFGTQLLSTQVVTLWYRAPELLLGCETYDISVDIWSVACIILELSNKAPRFPGTSLLDQIIKIFRLLGTPQVSSSDDYGTNLPFFAELYWPELSDEKQFKYWNKSFPRLPPYSWDLIANRLPPFGRSLIASMLIYDPKKRLSAAAALKSPYFAVPVKTQSVSVVTPNSDYGGQRSQGQSPEEDGSSNSHKRKFPFDVDPSLAHDISEDYRPANRLANASAMKGNHEKIQNKETILLQPKMRRFVKTDKQGQEPVLLKGKKY